LHRSPHEAHVISLVPSWAPNLHPLVIHFPIALLVVAVLADLVDQVAGRQTWLAPAGTALYALGAVGAGVACVTGQQAADTVLMSGMAHSIVAAHRTWALATTFYFGVLAIVRVALAFRSTPSGRGLRILLLVAAVIGLMGLQQTAERGGRLVYEQGVGVIGAGLR
jgi:uncharacterized membrane protein